MSSFKIVSDSSCDLPKELRERKEIALVPFSTTFDGEHYLRESIDISSAEFYRTLRSQNVFPKTSQPTVQHYMDAFNEALGSGQNVLCFCITTKFSGSYQSALIARNAALEEHSGAEIYAMDSTLCTGLQGLLVLAAVEMRDKGFSLAETYEKCNALKKTLRAYLTVDSLEYLQKGGRIGKVSALAGGLLNIKPVIAFKEGELIPVAKVRGRKKAAGELIRLLSADIGENKDDYLVIVVHSDEHEEAEQLKKELEKMGYRLNPDAPVFELGVTIGSHIGPTVIGAGYVEKWDK